MRKHVFPFIEPGFRLVDNDVVNSLGPEEDISLGKYNANEDKNVEWFFTTSGRLGVAILYLGKKDHEALIDFNETPDDVYSQVSGPQGFNVFSLNFGPLRNTGQTGEIDVELNLAPGSVFCVGLKNKTSDITLRPALLYGTFSDFSDLQYVFASPPNFGDNHSRPIIGVGEWATFMFDGKRFVLLGSNNWTS